jgi:hypothetical protein
MPRYVYGLFLHEGGKGFGFVCIFCDWKYNLKVFGFIKASCDDAFGKIEIHV